MAQVQRERSCRWHRVITSSWLTFTRRLAFPRCRRGLDTDMQRIVWPGVKCIIFSMKNGWCACGRPVKICIQISNAWSSSALDRMVLFKAKKFWCYPTQTKQRNWYATSLAGSKLGHSGQSGHGSGKEKTHLAWSEIFTPSFFGGQTRRSVLVKLPSYGYGYNGWWSKFLFFEHKDTSKQVLWLDEVT